VPVTDLHATDPRQLGPYELSGRLGRGGMGVVYLGRASDGSLAAVKAIRADLDGQPALRERFRREVDAARRVARFCTAPVLDADLDGPIPWIASEYVNGPTLQDVVVERGPMSRSSLEGLAVGVAGALAAIHAAGVIHRDLKPANVLLGEVGPRVIDFGIARHDELGPGEPGGGTRAQAGTPGFMAPEQHEGDPVGPAADVFAWAATIVFAGTGRLPFGTGPAASMAYRVVYGEPDLEGLDGRMLDVVRVCLAKDPEARPPAWTLLTWLTGDGTDPADAAAAVLRQRWAPPTPPPTGPAGRAGRSRPATRVLVAGALAGVLWVGGVAAATFVGTRSGETPPPPGPDVAASLPPPSTVPDDSPATTVVTPEINFGKPAAPRRPRRPAGLPGAELLLADDFTTKGNGWHETRPEEDYDGESTLYADGGLRMVTTSSDSQAPTQALVELRGVHAEVDVAFGGDPIGAVTVGLDEQDVRVRRDGKVTVEQRSDDPAKPEVLEAATSKAVRADGFNRVAVTCRAIDQRTVRITVTVNGEPVARVDGKRAKNVGFRIGAEAPSLTRPDPTAILLDNLALWGIKA
jgi:hypothetical protein